MKILFCKFNIDTACVEVWCNDGRVISIYTPAIEDEFAENMYQRSELDWLFYNTPAECATQILNRSSGKHSRSVIERVLADS